MTANRSKKFLAEFVGLYRNLDCVWKMKPEDQSDRVKKEPACDVLVTNTKTVDKDISNGLLPITVATATCNSFGGRRDTSFGDIEVSSVNNQPSKIPRALLYADGKRTAQFRTVHICAQL